MSDWTSRTVATTTIFLTSSSTGTLSTQQPVLPLPMAMNWSYRAIDWIDIYNFAKDKRVRGFLLN